MEIVNHSFVFSFTILSLSLTNHTSIPNYFDPLVQFFGLSAISVKSLLVALVKLP